MNWLNMPPLSALRAFSAFAEKRNVVDAGQSLNVSHAAISQQLRALEARMGTALIDRAGRTLSLTEAGERLANAVELGFGAIENAVQDLSDATAQRPLQISTTPTFASAWLVPRLTDFRIRHGDIDLVLDPTPTVVRLEHGGVDVAIRYGSGVFAGLHSEPLLMSPIVVVAAPALLKGLQIEQPSDLTSLPWLEELGSHEASTWLRSNGAEKGLVGARTQMPGNLLLSALLDGQGVSATVRHFVEADLKAGRLVELFTSSTGRGYFIVTRPGPLRPAAKAFVSWLRTHQTR
jgi:LysR family transcriptional regulator, glycine cleavage system transcriptional activator